MTRSTFVSLFCIALLPLGAGLAQPSLTGLAHEKPQDTQFPSKWQAQVRSGLLFNTGNARVLSFSASAMGLREWGRNRIRLDVDGALARSDIISVVDADDSGDITPNEYGRTLSTIAQNWAARARYDRFFGLHTSGFGGARVGGDVPAGKQLFGGGQVGVSQRLWKSKMAETVAELGYDFTAERYVIAVPNVAIHSARVALAHTQAFTETASVNVTSELLLNLNQENAPNPRGGNLVSPFEDLRFNMGASFQIRIVERVSLALGFKLRYDHNPALRPAVSAALPFAPGFRPFAQTLDTSTDATIQVDVL